MNHKEQFKPRLEPWLEWKEACTIDKCKTEEHVEYLKRFGFHRFCKNIEIINTKQCRQKSSSLSLPAYQHKDDAEDGSTKLFWWNLLEAKMIAGANKGGKLYKDWLFDRLNILKGTQVAIIESGASVLMRDVVRKHVCEEYCGKLEQSLDVPLGDDASFSMKDVYYVVHVYNACARWLIDEIIIRDYERLGGEIASPYFKSMSNRERVAVLASALDVSLANPEVCRMAGCQHAMVYAALHKCQKNITSIIADKYPEEDKESVRFLNYYSLLALSELCVEWGKSEKKCLPLFT
jgi:hypothetical protein